MPKPSKRDQLVEATKGYSGKWATRPCRLATFKPEAPPSPAASGRVSLATKLQALWDACVTEGLLSHPVKDAFIVQVVELLDPFATDFEFRYVKIGLKHLPTLEAVESAVADLMAAVRPHCEATVSAAIPDRGS